MGHQLIVVYLNDGRVRSVPWSDFSKLRNATKQQRKNFRIIGGGTGIHWPDIDEDISVEAIVRKR